MKIISVDPLSPIATELMAELSEVLATITGSDGTNSFDVTEMKQLESIFALAFDDEGRAIGCGAIRPFSPGTGEIKRMYARSGTKGVGTALLQYLEQQALRIGYQRLCLETRKVNERAVNFYQAKGYDVIDNYGRYQGRDDAVCFAKALVA
ncbi:GNAT family N-acetyltransferase [Gallaecimonas mangrovi]|uniref:GNAT family N-acetyltransferase n=1 Tax=Gallaecimonas mangrovi TaxID=2291597 RepID=UPI001D00345F|nr:GNAT family N-acetyltransferase [Gallaecimonas mangrovi]